MKVKAIVSLLIILSVLYLSATTISAENDGLRALGFIAGVDCGSLLGMWAVHYL